MVGEKLEVIVKSFVGIDHSTTYLIASITVTEGTESEYISSNRKQNGILKLYEG